MTDLQEFDQSRYISVGQASRVLGLTPNQICARLRKYGEYIPNRKVGRIRYILRTALTSIYMR